MTDRMDQLMNNLIRNPDFEIGWDESASLDAMRIAVTT